MSPEPFPARDTGVGAQDVEPPAKRTKLDPDQVVEQIPNVANGHVDGRTKGTARVKKEFRVVEDGLEPTAQNVIDDDAAEALDYASQSTKPSSRPEKQRGQNKGRDFGSSNDTKSLCTSRIQQPEFAPSNCKYKECKYEHDLRRYLVDGKRPDLETFAGKCPVLEARGKCDLGWKCRFVGSHSREREGTEGKKELVLLDSNGKDVGGDAEQQAENYPGISNIIPTAFRFQLERKKFSFEKSDKIVSWLEQLQDSSSTSGARNDDTAKDNRATYIESRFMPSEKRRLYYGPETPVLAPLTTQGNLPFRRLCVSLGAQVTWSEMAMSLPLIQGLKSEWALVRSHESEALPPLYTPSSPVQNYDHARDSKFGVQIAGNKPALAIRAAQVLTEVCPSLRAIDLNCGCPIDMVYRQGAGSALLDSPGKLEKILRGMNVVSGEVPITVKIRMGTKDNKPTAQRLINRLAFGETENASPARPCGVAAITLHGRSRQQRYSRRANWSYIADCAALIKSHNEEKDSLTDTIREAEARDLASSNDSNDNIYFLGNGDIYSHEDYNRHISEAGVSSCMVARGALIKPWIFEEIASGQHLDKSSLERLRYIETFCRNGLEYWGSDEFGIGYTRRFLLEWLSFAYRYVPVGILEHLPPNLQERPEKWRGRDDLETLLGSDNYKDWIKISEMFLGKANESFKFIPKHKANAYEDAEG